MKPVPPTAAGRSTLVRDISLRGVPENGSNASMVDVKNGKNIRIRPTLDRTSLALAKETPAGREAGGGPM